MGTFLCKILKKNERTEEQGQTEEEAEMPSRFLCLTPFLCIPKGVRFPDSLPASEIRRRNPFPL